MVTFMVVIVILIGVLSLAGTLYAGRQVNETIKTVDQAKSEYQENLLKANYYRNHKSNFSLMISIYVVLFMVFITMGIAAFFIFDK
jgi:flagellar basal body-associated protein FliL